ncbi:MAG: DUF1254 domain-containing protein [Thermodesulfobacteriota bacterium]|nr:DUF1254 domain-containing protein [Thermodesulfobacteriota bacterium]
MNETISSPIGYLPLIFIVFAIALFPVQVSAEEPTPGYNTKIPESILTPHDIETRAGTLKYFDGIPTKETAAALYNHLDYIRGVEAFLNGMPAASLEAIRRSQVAQGSINSNMVRIFDQLMDSNPLFLTGNTDTVYVSAVLDLKRDGPTVIEIPPGTGPGTVNDAFFRFVIDTGPPGPDQGKGGKYLVLPPDHVHLQGEVPDDYFVARSTSWTNWFIARGFLKDGKPDYSSKLFREGLKIYPLSKADNQPPMQFFNGSEKAFNTIHSTNFKFFEELHAVIEREPIEMLDPQLRGLFASIGIQKGKPFAPDDRMKKILTKAAEVGNATARTMLWYERDKLAFLYEGSNWKRGFVGGSYEFLKDGGLGGRNIDARAQFFYFATVNTPAMTWKLIGKGSQYAWGYLDSDDNYLDGSKTYQLNLPKDPPAKKFISIVLYDPQTRSQLQTSQPFPSYNSEKGKGKVALNDDGSLDLYIGPEAPAGKEANWLQTVPGKGWFLVLRLYSPTEAWFDKTWRPGEIELVK